MKRVLLFVLMLVALAFGAAPAPAQAAGTYITKSQIKAYDGNVRRSPCQANSDDNCGSEPPTFNASTNQCGTIWSTSSARNESFLRIRTTNGSTADFTFNFPYLDTSHVEVLALRSAWSSGSTYASGDQVSSGDNIYQSVQNDNLNHAVTDGAWWSLVGSGLKTQGVDYTITPAGPSGTVTFTVAPASDYLVNIRLKTTWDGDGVTTAFPFYFKLPYLESLEARVDGTLQTYGTHYSISGVGSSVGGTVTFVTPPPAGTRNVLARMVAISTKGVKINWPTNAALLADGYQPSGASPLSGPNNREGQCRMGLVPAAPAPFNFGIWGVNGGVLGADKFTNIWEGGPSIDFYDGELTLPMLWGIDWRVWNGTSILYDGSSPPYAERAGMGQTSSQGQGRLFLVTADWPWQTTGSNIGKLAYCPHNGRGLNTNANDHPTRALMPVGCVYAAPSGSSIDYVQVTQNTGSFAKNVTAGAAYAAGTSPDGTPYPAGNYVVITTTASVNTVQNGNTMAVVSLPMALGTKTSGKWLVKRLTPGVDPGCAATAPGCFQLHEEVQDWNQNKVWGVGPPSRFVPGDTARDYPAWNAGTTYASGATVSDPSGGFFSSKKAGNLNHATSDTLWWTSTSVACCMSHALSTVSLAGGRRTDPVMGAELVGSIVAPEGTIVGLARVSSGVYNDTTASRDVASWFNPVEKMVEFSPSADKSFSSTSDAEVDTTTRGNFVYLDGVSTRAKVLGDTGRPVRWQVSATVSNNTAGGGCQLNVNFNGGANEVTAPPVMVNPSGVSGGKTTITFSGTKTGLAPGAHTLRLMGKAVSAGTCTVYKDNTRISAWVMQ